MEIEISLLKNIGIRIVTATLLVMVKIWISMGNEMHKLYSIHSRVFYGKQTNKQWVICMHIDMEECPWYIFKLKPKKHNSIEAIVKFTYKTKIISFIEKQNWRIKHIFPLTDFRIHLIFNLDKNKFYEEEF